MSARSEWTKVQVLAKLKDEPFVAVLSDGPESYHVIYVDEVWQAFAIAWWNNKYESYGDCSVNLVTAACLLPGGARPWDKGAFRDGGLEDSKDWNSDKYFWTRKNFDRIGLVKDVHYILEVQKRPDPARGYTSREPEVCVELTEEGKRWALAYAREQIEKECEAAGKPLPWEVSCP